MGIHNMVLSGGNSSGNGTANLKYSLANNYSGGTSITFTVDNDPTEFIFVTSPANSQITVTDTDYHVISVVKTADYKKLCWFYYNVTVCTYRVSAMSGVSTSYSNGSLTLTFTGYVIDSGNHMLYYW